MKNVKTPMSESYQSYLMSRLSDPTYAAVYLETHFEETTPDPELLKLALKNVAEALLIQSPTQQAEQQRQLEVWLAQPGRDAIHGLARWLNQLGLKLTVMVDRPLTDKLPVNHASLSQISGNVSNSVSQLQANRPEAAQLADLLQQLQTAIETETDANLTDTDKAEALEQVGTLAKAGENPQADTAQKSANTAVKILRGTIAALPDTAKLAEACSKLLPAIVSLLGL